MNPRVAKQHRISNPTPYRARLSRHLDALLLKEKRIFNHCRPFNFYDSFVFAGKIIKVSMHRLVTYSICSLQNLSSAPRPRKRLLSAVGLLPSGPGPMPTIKKAEPKLLLSRQSPHSQQDKVSTLRFQT